MTEIRQMLATKGTACRPGHALNVKYITIHNTANLSKGAGALNHAKLLQGGGASKTVSWHYAVDDNLITQSIPDGEVAWHAGTNAGNYNSIGIEICENPDSDLTTATNNAAELTAALMKKYGIPLANIKQHYNWSGKNCPNRIRAGQPYSWATFLSKVEAAYNAGGGGGSVTVPSTKAHTVVTVSPVSIGDKNTLANKAKALALPCSEKKDGNMYTLEIGPMTAGDNVAITALAESLQLSFSVRNALYVLIIGPMSAGDYNALVAVCDKLLLKYTEAKGSAGTTLTVGPVSHGDKNTLESLADSLKLGCKIVAE